jgi:hypothetical protein
MAETKSIFSRSIAIVFACIVLLVAAVAWHLFLLPASIDEALFRYRLESAAERGAKEIRLSEMAKFDWEEVCSHHPYDGDFTYAKYKRTYQASAIECCTGRHLGSSLH